MRDPELLQMNVPAPADPRPAPVRRPASTIRGLAPADLPTIAAMFQATFVKSRAPAPASLEAYLGDLFLDHPWYEPEIASRVNCDPHGAVNGFIGVLPLQLVFRGKPLRAAVAGSLMVRDPKTDPLAGARLVRSFLTGPQDVSISETANAISVGMWERMGHKPIVSYSMDWLRILRPAGFAAALAAEAAGPAAVLRPPAAAADFATARFNPLRPGLEETGRCTDADLSEAEAVKHIRDISGRYPLRPAWDEATLGWVLGHASEKERHGTMFRRAVFGRRGELLGCYIYYGRPRGIAWVLEILASEEAAGPVIDSLLRHAWSTGCVAVRGRARPRISEALLRRKSVFFRRAATFIHARDPDVMAAVNSGDALVTGLAGELWTRLIGGRFA